MHFILSEALCHVSIIHEYMNSIPSLSHTPLTHPSVYPTLSSSFPSIYPSTISPPSSLLLHPPLLLSTLHSLNHSPTQMHHTHSLHLPPPHLSFSFSFIPSYPPPPPPPPPPPSSSSSSPSPTLSTHPTPSPPFLLLFYPTPSHHPCLCRYSLTSSLKLLGLMCSVTQSSSS